MLSTANPEMFPKKKLMSLTSTVTIHVYLMNGLGLLSDKFRYSLYTDDCRNMVKYLYKSILSLILSFGIFYM